MKKLLIKAEILKFQIMKKLAEKRGSFFTENALTIVITVAIAGLVLTILFALFKDKLAPLLSKKVDEFANYNG